MPTTTEERPSSMPAETPHPPGADRPEQPAGQTPLPPAATMGLLNYLTATSLDADYEAAARARGSRGESAVRPPGRVALVVLAAFGILVATAAVQTAQSADVTRSSHDGLVKQVVARKQQLADRRDLADRLASEVRTLDSALLSATVAGRAVQSRLSSLGVVTGAEASRGPGVRIVADDGPGGTAKSEVLDVDLQRMVNGLWVSGAEAISINGQRITALTAIREAGGIVTVNYQRISAPYTVLAIGDPDTLPARFIDSAGGQWWLDLQAVYGVSFDINTEERLTLPAEDQLELRYAFTPETLR